MKSEAPEIRAILAPLIQSHILVPSNVVAEVIEYSKPMPYEHGPAWLLGELEWNAWQVPIISYALLADITRRDPVTSDSRILILKTLTEETSLNYLGVLIKGLPKLKKLSPDALTPLEKSSDSSVVYCLATMDELEVMVPELEEVTRSVTDALYDQ